MDDQRPLGFAPFSDGTEAHAGLRFFHGAGLRIGNCVVQSEFSDGKGYGIVTDHAVVSLDSKPSVKIGVSASVSISILTIQSPITPSWSA